MSSEIELLSDGDGIALFGDATEIDLYLANAGIASRDIAIMSRSQSVLSTGAGVAQAGSELTAGAGRWVKLTEESAKAMKTSSLMKGSTSGVKRAVVTTDKGKVSSLLEIVDPKTLTATFTNPAVLTGAAGLMAQLAMQQTMDEITDYLAKIDEKVDDILRAQKDSVLAEMIGAGLVIDDAITVREHTGRVSDVTWSRVQGTAQTIAATQAYALRRLDALAEKLEKKRNRGEVSEVAASAEVIVREWLAVLARCFQLSDGLAVLELERVRDAKPEELDAHRAGLQAARRKRRERIAGTTGQLLERIDAVAGSANARALLHPMRAEGVVRSRNAVAVDVSAFHERLGIGTAHGAIEAKRWSAAVTEARDKAIETGAESVDAARRLGLSTLEHAKSVGGSLSQKIVERLAQRRGSDGADEED